LVAGTGALAAEAAASALVAGFRLGGADPLAVLVAGFQDTRLFRPVIAGAAAGRALAVRIELLCRTGQRAVGRAAVALALGRAFGTFARFTLPALGAFRLLFGDRTGAGRHPDIGFTGAGRRLALRLAIETVVITVPI